MNGVRRERGRTAAWAGALTCGMWLSLVLAGPALAIMPFMEMGNDVTEVEGDAGTKLFMFTVRGSWGTAGIPATATYTTVPGTATEGVDYLPTSGEITFRCVIVPQDPCLTSQTIAVTVIGDTKFEPDETFFVVLHGVGGTLILRDRATGTIVNDDPPPIQPGASDARAIPTLTQLALCALAFGVAAIGTAVLAASRRNTGWRWGDSHIAGRRRG